MKKKLLLFIALLLLPVVTFAKDDPGLNVKLHDILSKYKKDGVLVIDSISTLEEGFLYGEPSNTDVAGDTLSRVVGAYIHSLPEVVDLLAEYDDEVPRIDVYCLSYTNCGIDIAYKNDNRGYGDGDSEYPNDRFTHYDISIKHTSEYDSNAYNKIKSLYQEGISAFEKDYYITDLSYINQLYNYNFGEENMVNTLSSRPSILAKSVPEIKNIYENSPGYDVKYGLISAMGNGWNSVEFTLSADFVNFYNNTAYLNSTLLFHIVPVLFVDENTPDDKIIEVAKKRIEDYINDNRVKVVIDDITPAIDPDDLGEIYSDLDAYLTTLGKQSDANTRVYSLKIGNTVSPKNFFIIKANSSLIKDLEILTIERNTGVKLTSSSIDVMLLVIFIN